MWLNNCLLTSSSRRVPKLCWLMSSRSEHDKLRPACLFDLNVWRKCMCPASGPIRAFLYARSACESQIAPTARANEQLTLLRKHARDRSYVVVGEACDAAQSGIKLSRPGLTMVMSEATCIPPNFDLLLATDHARLARSPELFLAIVSRLTGSGIKIEFLDGIFFEAPLGEWDALEEAFRARVSRYLGGNGEED
ncbi:recombinase family protein [Rhizobium leguminosarum]|uniref:recombinase family protein n=1 Tax=Rhizobium leguminosarum TaxID=384 RepID=UPI0009E54C95